MDEEKIILVQQYMELYDQSNPNYHNQLRRQNIWEEIGEAMGIDGEVCRKKWTQIHDNYRKALKARQTKSGQAATSSKPARFEKELEFVKVFLANRSQKSNMEDGKSNESNEDGESSSTPSSSKRCQESTSQSVLKEYLVYKKVKLDRTDHLTKYFQSLEETVRTFPTKYQIETKMKLSALIHQMEFRIFMENQTSEQSSREFQIQENPQYTALEPVQTDSQYRPLAPSPTDSSPFSPPATNKQILFSNSYFKTL